MLIWRQKSGRVEVFLGRVGAFAIGAVILRHFDDDIGRIQDEGRLFLNVKGRVG